ncbi:MAG: pyridoxamine 5'-phosphate oxidase family protein [Clostridia bacterium]|nr:pyridoxamine 5'-phosphate oxidase family protein [Clostridia bacterium]
MQFNQEIDQLLSERFSKDSLIALATCEGATPSVRAVNTVYADGAFWVITYAKSGKMRQIAVNPIVGLCGEWFTGHGTAQSLGHVLLPDNAAMMVILRKAFADWYGNGHVNEADPDTILLCITVTDGVFFRNGTRYEFTR